MRRVLKAAPFLALAVLLLPREAAACSCESEPSDLASALLRARKRADAVFVGRVRVIDFEPTSGRRGLNVVTFDVAQTFKGPAHKQHVVMTIPFDGATCGYPFEVGEDYLVYADKDEKPTGRFITSWCSRTQLAAHARLETEALKSGKMPAPPAALRVETVECAPCDPYELLGRSVCAGRDDCSRSSPREVAAALDGGTSFWEIRWQGGPLQTFYGRAADGGLFLLEFTEHPARKKCHSRLTSRRCDRLELSQPRPEVAAEPVCMGKSAPELVCDESTTRKSSWSEPRAVSGLACKWYHADVGHCSLGSTTTPLPRGAPTSPGLWCEPVGLFDYSCRRIPDAAETPGKP